MLSSHTDLVLSLDVLPDNMLASGSADQTIKIWDPVKKSIIKNVKRSY